MFAKTIVRTNAYYDSITLMSLTSQVSEMAGVQDIMVGMGTDLNKESLARLDLLTEEANASSPNDLLIGVCVIDEETLDAVLEETDSILAAKKGPSKSNVSEDEQPRSIEKACQLSPGYNMAVISVPGVYAAREARQALRQGMHVFLFSDNVSVEDEILLKKTASAEDRLMMGPDCGTSIINGVPLGFANRVRRGSIGIVGASGTGIQQVSTLIDCLGEGISQAIGTGGRDLSDKVGGLTTLTALELLTADDSTKIIVLISKPPAQAVVGKIIAKAKLINKPVVICFLGNKTPLESVSNNITICNNLEEAAIQAVGLASGSNNITLPDEDACGFIKTANSQLKDSQRYVRALFGGGTLCEESMMVFRNLGISYFSNVPSVKTEALADVEESKENTFLDMGEDHFTRGRPHPMLEPSLRVPRLLKEAADPEVAVILFDVILGHGSHSDPAGVMAAAVKQAKEAAAKDGRQLSFVASLVGTQADPQNFDQQKRILEQEGVFVCVSNYRAANLTANLLKK